MVVVTPAARRARPGSLGGHRRRARLRAAGLVRGHRGPAQRRAATTDGAVGLLGPTRMNYPQALAAAHVVGERLGERLGDSLRCAFRRPGRQSTATTEEGRPWRVADGSTDLYALLGVAPSATDDEIKSAYRRRARELHPDANGGDAGGREPNSRRSRWPTRSSGTPSAGPATTATAPRASSASRPAGPGPRSTSTAGWATSSRRSSAPWPAAGRGRRRGPMPGADAEVDLALDFAEAAFGARQGAVGPPARDLRHVHWLGGQPGHRAGRRARTARAPGEIRRIRQSLLGQVVTSVACARCQGLGETIPDPCPDCRGEGRRMEDRDLRGRGPGRRGGRVDPAPGRPGPGRPPGRAQRLALRPPVGDGPTSGSSGPATTCTPRSTWAWPRPRSGTQRRGRDPGGAPEGGGGPRAPSPATWSG